MDDQKLIDIQAVADLLGCSPRHVYRMVDDGKMPRPVKLGALVRWQREVIFNWITGGCQPPSHAQTDSQE